MKKKQTSRASKSVKNLRVKTTGAKTAKRVKGGTSLSYGKIEFEYKPQKPDGSL